MKKIILFFLSFLLTLSLAGCDLFTSYDQIAASALLKAYINNSKLASTRVRTSYWFVTTTATPKMYLPGY